TDEAGGAGDPVSEHEGLEAARFGGCTRAAIERCGEAPFGVSEGHVDPIGGARGLDEPAERLLELIRAEPDVERADHGHRKQQHDDPTAYAGVLRFYELAKRAEWQVRDLPWGEIPPIPETKGAPQKVARRRDMWRSVITQQLQADELACEMASQLLNIAPDHEAKLYYSTMVQDESRHTEAWLRLSGEIGGTAERDPHLDTLAHMTLEADTLEEKVFQ